MKEWVGLQFNFDKDIRLETWLEKYKGVGITTDGEHISFDLGKNELKRLEKGSRKARIIKAVLKRYLKSSEYTNIYTYLDADGLRKQKLKLSKGEFREAIVIKDFKDKKTILGNYTFLESEQIRKLMEKAPQMIIMDEIFDFVVGRNFEIQQRLVLSISYETKEEEGEDRDNLNISIQLENWGDE